VGERITFIGRTIFYGFFLRGGEINTRVIPAQSFLALVDTPPGTLIALKGCHGETILAFPAEK